MRKFWIGAVAMLGVTALGVSLAGAVTADDNDKKPAAPVMAFWAMPKEAGSMTVIELGTEAPKTVVMNQDAIASGMCQDCMLMFKFKLSESNKNCAVCGCAVSNAQCMAGKPTKGTWAAMFEGLPRGVALRPVYNTADKPESGFKIINVDRHTVFLAVDGLSSQMPDQIAALVKAAGGTKGELVDNGKRLMFSTKEEWNHERQAKFEKALIKVGAKVAVPEAVK